MDPAEIRFIRKVFIKERGEEVFRKIRLSLVLCESPLKLQRHLEQLLAIWKQITNSAHSSVHGLLLTTCSCWQQRYEQFGSYCQWSNEHFKPRMLLFSVGNGACSDIGNGAMNSSAILATTQ
jgi:hypothetical protein